MSPVSDEFLCGAGRAVRAGLPHRLVGVGHPEEAPGSGDGGAGRSEGVARAVEALVVAQHERGELTRAAEVALAQGHPGLGRELLADVEAVVRTAVDHQDERARAGRPHPNGASP